MAMPNFDLPNMTENTKVLTIMRDALISHDTRLQNIRDDLNETQADVEILKASVITGTGNNLSLSERVRTLEAFAEGVKDTIKYWGRLIGGALLLNFIGFSTGIIIALIKFLPVLQKLAEKP